MALNQTVLFLNKTLIAVTKLLKMMIIMQISGSVIKLALLTKLKLIINILYVKIILIQILKT